MLSAVRKVGHMGILCDTNMSPEELGTHIKRKFYQTNERGRQGEISNPHPSERSEPACGAVVCA